MNGVEDVSSDEDETNFKQVEEVKASETRIVEVKRSKSKDVIQIDDTGKEEGAIVKEILENMTIQIENNKLENKTDAVARRRKSKDKKDRRESVKFRLTSSSVKDTRDINERLKAQACYGDDVELDYDDTVHDESKDRQASESDGEITVSMWSMALLDDNLDKLLLTNKWPILSLGTVHCMLEVGLCIARHLLIRNILQCGFTYIQYCTMQETNVLSTTYVFTVHIKWSYMYVYYKVYNNNVWCI